MFDEYKKSLRTCLNCPSLCQSVCPVFLNDGNRSHSPWGLMQILNGVRKHELPFNEQTALEPYHCVGCRACTEKCEHHIPVSDIMQKARNEAFRQELAPEAVKSFVERFHKHNNPFARDLVHKLQKMLHQKYFKRNTSVVYFSSCTTIAKCPEVIKDTFALFDKLKIDFVGLYADPIHCCGYPLLCCGAEYDFVDLAEINFHTLKKYKTIITSCPVCAHMLKNVYAQYDFHLESQVVTINEFLKPYLQEVSYTLKKNIRSRYLFHDPCYLARYMRESDLPRKLLSQVSGHEALEFGDNRLECTSCGQGGAYPIIEKERADQITRKRLEECREKDCNTIITQCPICIYKMRQAGKKIIVKDVVSFLNDCIEEVDP